MKKYFILKLSFLLIAFNSFSQNDIDISSKIEIIPTKENVLHKIHTTPEAVIRLKKRSYSNLIIEIENLKTKKVKTHDFENYYWSGSYKNNFYYEALIEDHKGAVWLFLSTYTVDKHKLYRRELKTDGTLGKNIFVTERNLEKKGYHVIQSENKKSYSILTYASDKKKRKTKFILEVRDQDFQTSWKMSNYLDAESDKAFFQEDNLVLTNEGTLFGLMKFRNSEKRKDVFYKLYVFKKGEKQYLDYPIHHAEKNIHSLKMTLSEDQHIIVSGFYYMAKKNNYNKIEGVYFLNLDSNPLQLVTETFSPFTKEHLEKIIVPEIRPFFPNQQGFAEHQQDLIRNVQGRKDTMIDDDYYSLQLIPHKNNSFTLVTERLKIGNNMLLSDEFQLFNFNHFGKLNWIKCVERFDPITAKTPYGAHGTQTRKVFDKTFIFYKDKAKSIMLLVDSNGTVQQELINDYATSGKYMLYPLLLYKTSDHSFKGHLFYKAMYHKKGKDAKYIFIDLKDKNDTDAK
ncbi:hypothetical protein [Flammeovirga aprica]|uniref:Uncharacterized protein n=1 Tax=Flammeovirga aprica JL-4 TaxID=694437 RepID=A0A7X9P217_9BACT|nr:hypothetical protein [Flammeovirga aprica]NME68108.1 hypothetical protein [Flammeovirga aprica JL-4]